MGACESELPPQPPLLSLSTQRLIRANQSYADLGIKSMM